MSRIEFDAWLKANSEHFRDYEGWEIARLALCCGFTMAEIAPDLSEWASVSQRRLSFWTNPLMQQWVELWGYEHGNEWDTKAIDKLPKFWYTKVAKDGD